MDVQSTLTQLLPYIEQDNIYKQININNRYNWTGHNNVFKTKVKTFLCPSNGASADDPQGYGQTDYMPVAYCDIDPTNGQRCTINGTCATYRSAALLTLHYGMDPAGSVTAGNHVSSYLKMSPRRVTAVTDGTSSTIAIIEDVGKNHESLSPFMKASYADNCGDCTDKSPTGLRNNYRWGEPDSANGISGPHNDTVNKVARINNNATPKGGPTSCAWSNNNCGPNDEPFSFHSGGVQAVFGDGHVQFIRDSISAQTLRAICTADFGDQVNLD
jgi:prepilin-type processing-associated H-X9-DG protein